MKDFRNKPTAEKMAIVQSEYDKAVKKGLIKKNTASRRKANLAKWAKEHGVKFAENKKAAPAKAATKKEVEKPAEAKEPVAKKPAAKKPAAKKTTAKKAEEK